MGRESADSTDQESHQMDGEPRNRKGLPLTQDSVHFGPTLMHFDPERPGNIETDGSHNVSARVISQIDNKGILHPVAYFSKKHSLTECNYQTFGVELLVVIHCFEG